MGKLKKGFIQIYTGNGKGKTTAALGQALRASGSGLKSLIIQFMKNFPYGEIAAIKHYGEHISIEQYGDDSFVFKKQPPEEHDKLTARKALERARAALLSGEYDIVILDEVCVSIYFGLFQAKDVIPLLEIKPDDVELILTGRYCPEELLNKADLITEMKEVRHYFQKGITSRKGIES
ncbi:MAG: cob(I)yrinic acid a,c-diamide adenosyltransferase [Ignavibacteriales bacterium]